jgi:hypothetical protein
VIPSIMTLNAQAECHNAKCPNPVHLAEYRYADWHYANYANWHFAECRRTKRATGGGGDIKLRSSPL